MKKYNLKEIKEILDEAENADGLKEWYYPEAIAKLLFNQAVDTNCVNEVDDEK